MRIRIMGIAGLLGIALLAAPQIGSPGASAQSQGTTGAKKQVSYNGVSFTYDTSLAGSVSASTQPAFIIKEDSGYWLAHPEQVTFEFKNFAYATSQMASATIYVFPIKSSYRYLNPAEPQDLWLPRIDQLRTLLSQRPKLTDPVTIGDPKLPFLPIINAAMTLVGKQDYLNFRDGSGVCYLASFAQDVEQPSHENTLYTYQGITNDGRYYVAATFPAFLATPPNMPFPCCSTERDLENYYHSLRATVNAAPGSAFRPNLDLLDEMMRSLSIDTSSVKLPSTTVSSSNAPGMPNTGHDPGDPSLLLLVAAGLGAILVGFGLALAGGRSR